MFAPFAKIRASAVRWLQSSSLWKRGVLWLLVFTSVFAAGGFLFVWLGFAPVAASAGHWPLTDWFLHFAMRNAVETRSLGTKVPPLDDPAAVLKGAGHYATGCAPCHGAPGEARSLIAQQTTPPPPFLPHKIPGWKPGQLFWIVKNGVKFTAMPAWPALEREDEIWAMVAFLQQLPGMSAERYERLAYGSRADIGPGQDASPDRLRALAEPLGAVLANCSRCHGNEGQGRGTGAFPKLALQREAYLLASLRAFADGERYSGVMQPVAAGLNDDTMAALAEHFARRVKPVQSPSGLEKADAIERGRLIAEQGVFEQGIPACIDCHGPRAGPRNPMYPNLAGQYADYLLLQLRLFKSGQRGGTPYAHVMTTVAQRVSEQQMRDLAVYFASLSHQ